MRKAFLFLTFVVSTIVLSCAGIVTAFFDKRGETVHKLARLWGNVQLKAAGIRLQVEGLEHVQSPPYIFMCNHQSALDIYTLYSCLPVSFKWIAKRSLFQLPFLGWCMRAAGYISIDRENPREALKAINEAALKIKDGTNILIFPEGTRSTDGRLLPLKKGAFSLVLRAGVPVIPVGIVGTSRCQPKDCFLPVAKGTIYVRIGEPIQVDDEKPSAKAKIMMDVTSRLEELTGESGRRRDGQESGSAGVPTVVDG